MSSTSLEQSEVDQKVHDALEELEHGDRTKGIHLTHNAIELVIDCSSITITQTALMLNEVSRTYDAANLPKEVKELDDRIESFVDELSDHETKMHIRKEMEHRRITIKRSPRPLGSARQHRAQLQQPQNSVRPFQPSLSGPSQRFSRSLTSIPEWGLRNTDTEHRSARSSSPSFQPHLSYTGSPQRRKPRAYNVATDLVGDGRRIHGDETKHSPPPSEQRSHFASNNLNTLEGKADEWFDYLATKTHPFIRGQDERFQNEAYEPVRVAVLDTGFSDGSRWTQSFSGKVEKCFSCLPGEKNGYIDLEGHGTDVVYQVSRVCPNAKLYSYRVAHRINGNLCADKEAVLEALRRAVEEEKVHVINMSFGWQYNDDDVGKWLYKAQEAGILMFASVANFGALSSQNSLYPARSPLVIAVDAADGLGEPASFNSSTETGDVMLRFTAPGQGVRGHNPENRCNGTSYASPIAAGIAALVLEFAQQTPLAGDIAFKYLRKMDGMVRIFNKMSVQKTNPKFKFLVPWELLSDERGTFGGDGGPKSQRYYVARLIVEELRKIYTEKEIGSKIAD